MGILIALVGLGLIGNFSYFTGVLANVVASPRTQKTF
jgi:hypothetical protein